MLTKRTVQSIASLATVSCLLLLIQACATPVRITENNKITIPAGEVAIFLNKNTLELNVVGDPGTGKLEKGKKCNFKGQGPKVCKGSVNTSPTLLKSISVLKTNASPDCWFFYLSGGVLVGWPPGCS